jgi:membrane-bound serine protease (ClpP class)
MKRLLVGLLVAVCAFAAVRVHAQSVPRVALTTVDGPIDSVVYDYLNRAITMAEQDVASALVVQLNTPGGDLGSMLRIIQRFAASRVPIIVYVTPQRAQAASAGTIVTLGAHLAAMAPQTVIGAASPVSGGGTNLSSDERNKVVNDMRATVRALTRTRSQAAQDWAEKAITDAVATHEDDALKLGVIDLVANDLADLLAKSDGRKVTVGGAAVTLATAHAETYSIDMTLGEELLNILVDPNIAVVLLTIAITGLFIEFQAPGTIVGGVVGALAFVLFLYSVGTLSVNLTGLIFVGLAVLMFIFDLTAVQHGALTVGGIGSFVLGVLILFQPSYMPVSLGLVGGIALALAGLMLVAYRKVWQSRRLKPATGIQGLIGSIAVARTDLSPQGYVFVDGERWDAISDSGPLHAGDRLLITAVEGLKLKVKKAE